MIIHPVLDVRFFDRIARFKEEHRNEGELMRIAYTILMLLYLGISPVFGQTEKTQPDTFVKKVNEGGWLRTAIQTADDGFVTASSFLTAGSIDPLSILIFKMSSSGERQWETKLNFRADKISPYATVSKIAQTADGGFIIVGQLGCYWLDCEDDRPPSGATLIKLDSNGLLIWKKNLAVNGFDGNIFNSVTTTEDGGIIVAGQMIRTFYEGTAPILVMKFSSTGGVIWKKSFATSPNPPGFEIDSMTTSDHGIVIAFTRRNEINNPKGFNVMKITDSGNLMWKKTITTDGFVFQSMSPAADDGIMFIGTCKNCNKLFVTALKQNGTLNWKAAYPLRLPGRISSVSKSIQTSNGGYVVAGNTYVDSSATNYGFVAKIDASKRIEFQNTIGNSYASGPAGTSSIFNSPDHGFILFAWGQDRFENDLFILKLNSEATVPGCDLLEIKQFGSTTSSSFEPMKIAGVKVIESKALSYESLNFDVSTEVVNHSISTLCH